MVYQREDPLASKTALIVVADSVGAQIFQRKTLHSPLRQIKHLTHPEGRLREQDLTSDLSGDTFDSHGFGRHSMGADYSPKTHDLRQFAKSICECVEQCKTTGGFDELILVAPPKLLGFIREHLSPTARRALTNELPKRLPKATPETVAKVLAGITRNP